MGSVAVEGSQRVCGRSLTSRDRDTDAIDAAVDACVSGVLVAHALISTVFRVDQLLHLREESSKLDALSGQSVRRRWGRGLLNRPVDETVALEFLESAG